MFNEKNSKKIEKNYGGDELEFKNPSDIKYLNDLILKFKKKTAEMIIIKYFMIHQSMI